MQGHFQVDIALGNAAMNSHGDIARALQQVARRLVNDAGEGGIHDEDGNTVGSYGIPTRKSWTRVHQQGYREGRDAARRELIGELKAILRVGEADEEGILPSSAADIADGVYALIARHGVRIA